MKKKKQKKTTIVEPFQIRRNRAKIDSSTYIYITTNFPDLVQALQ